MIEILNRIGLCSKGSFRKRHLSDILGIVVHRIGPVSGVHQGKRWPLSEAETIARFFQNFPAIGKMAYTFVVLPNGDIEQALPLSYKAPGAINLNPNFIQVAVVGDFRDQPPTVAQGVSLTNLCVSLSRMMGTMDVRGHDETDGASGYDKVCPGGHLNIKGLRQSVVERYWKADTLEGVVV